MSQTGYLGIDVSKGENPPALDHRKQRVDAPPLGGWEVR